MAHDLVVGAEAPPQARIIPPALPLLDKPLGPLKFLQVTFRNNLATAATETYEQLFHRGRVLGRDYVLANEPSAARHIFGAGAAGDSGAGAFKLLGAATLVLVAIGPFAAGAAVRAARG